MKILLAQESKYTLTEADKIHTGAIDKLLHAQAWFTPSDPSQTTSTWQKTIFDYKLYLRIETTMEEMTQRQNQANEEESGE